ncbi:MAG: efflux RND transporter periplasmic adaptor subunit [Bacteroidales bacterium]|nr:efflux RND transporter periplasmic adaptor subunit [Bacteroidales bacterium]
MKTFWKVLIVIVIVAAFGGTLVYLYQKSQSKPVVYETSTPFYTDIVKKTVATGSVVPRKEIEIKPQVSGIIQELYVEAGDYVEEDDLIAKVKIIPNMVSLNEAQSRLNKAEIRLENEKINYKRQKELYEEGVIPESTYLEYELSYNQAKEELEAAENNLQLIKEGTAKNSGDNTNTLVRSTITGMVLDVPVEIGNSVIESNTFNDGTTIASVADMNEMVFEGKLDESEVGKVQEGMPLTLTIGAIEGKTFDAELEHISPKGLEENGAIQFEIRAAVKLKESDFIRAGYSANADIVLNSADSVLAIKESMITFENDTAYVEVETDPQKFEKQRIKTGLSDGINIQVKSGLEKDTKLKMPNRQIEG